MNRSLPLALAAAVGLALGCPKRTPIGVAGSDDEQMDQYAAQLEELRTRAKAQEPKCDDWCSMAGRVCDLSKSVCEIAARHADRSDMQKRCGDSQEDCADFKDSCSNCRR